MEFLTTTKTIYSSLNNQTKNEILKFMQNVNKFSLQTEFMYFVKKIYFINGYILLEFNKYD